MTEKRGRPPKVRRVIVEVAYGDLWVWQGSYEKVPEAEAAIADLTRWGVLQPQRETRVRQVG